MKFFIPAIIIILFFYSECYMKRSTRKKIKQTFPVQPINYMENPTCKNIVETINRSNYNKDADSDNYGNVDEWMQAFSHFYIVQRLGNEYKEYKDNINQIFNFHVDFYRDIGEKTYFYYNVTEEDFSPTVIVHFSLFPKILRKALKKCHDLIKDLEEMINFNKNDCLGLSDGELRNIFEEIIRNSANFKEYTRDMFKNIYKKRENLDFCGEIRNYSKNEGEYDVGLRYKSINCFLTTDMKNFVSNEVVKGLNEIINKLKLALEFECKQLTIPENGKILHRGQYFKPIIKEGDVLANLGFLSTSLDRETSIWFAKKSGQYGALFIIKNTNFNDSNTVKILGKYIKEVSLAKGEEEVLLLPNQCFKTISVNVVEDMRHIELEAVDCKHVKNAINF